MMDKSHWRNELKSIRSSVKTDVTKRILANTRDWLLERRPLCVHGYLAKSAAGEIETRDLLAFFVSSRVKVVVPRIVDSHLGSMELVVWNPNMPMQVNRFGIEEPIGGEIVSSSDVDHWIVPLLGADKQGFRLGYGAGFYDRMLQGTPGIKIGLLPDACWVDQLPHDPHDVPMDVLITENGVFNPYL